MHFFRILIFIFCSLSAIPLSGYESGFEETFDESDQVDCLSILKSSYEESDPMWTETHCKKTANAIIDAMEDKGIIEKDNEDECDLEKFADSSLGKTLLSATKELEHRLFHINLCGSAHVFVVEKKSEDSATQWRIFQSWQREFTLAQWLSIKRWNNEKFEDDFYAFGAGQPINQSQLMTFLDKEVVECRPKLRAFSACGLGEPYELNVTSFLFKQ